MNDLLPWRVEIKEGPHSAGGLVLWVMHFQWSSESLRDRTTPASPLKVFSIHPFSHRDPWNDSRQKIGPGMELS